MKVMIHIGLDVHNDSIAVSLAPSDSTEVRRWGILGGTHEHVQRFIKQVQAAHPDATLRFCYEAGPRGFPLCRFLRGLGYECLIVCPSRVPRAPGDRVKTDRRDADQLARLLRAGELTGIHVPEPEDEAIRDLLRSRDQVRRAQHRARQQLKMFLLRHNIRYAGTTSWTPAHLRYLARIKMPHPAQQFALQELLHSITEAGERLERYAAQLARFEMPATAVKLLETIIEELALGHPVTLVPMRDELSTQETAALLGVSRPHLVALLERGVIPFHKVGSHRRVKLSSALEYQSKLEALAELTREAQELGLGY